MLNGLGDEFWFVMLYEVTATPRYGLCTTRYLPRERGLAVLPRVVHRGQRQIPQRRGVIVPAARTEADETLRQFESAIDPRRQ